MSEFELDTKNTAIIMLVMIGIFSFILLGMTGFRTIIGILFLFFVPLYLILNKASLAFGEKLIFSFFLGIGFFPSVVYYLGLFIGVRKAIIVTFIIFLITGVIINKIKKQGSSYE